MLKIIILFIGIVVLVGMWILFTKIDEQLSTIDDLEKENKEQQKLIKRLESINEQKQTKREVNNVDGVKKSVDLFIQSVFTITQTNYQERKDDGKNILSNEIYQKLFDSDEELDTNFEYHPKNINIYVDIKSDKEASSFVTFKNAIKNLNTDELSHEFTTIEVHLNKQGHTWVIDDFDVIDEQSI